MAVRVRLRPRLAIGTHVFLLLFLVLGAFVGFVGFRGFGLMEAAFMLVWGAAVAAWVLTWRVTLPARLHLPPGDVDRVDGSRTAAALLLVMGVLGWPAALLMGAAAVSSPEDLTRPGNGVFVGIGALLLVPAWFRLLTGRLHLWRLELEPDVLRWVAVRKVKEVSWSDIRDLELREHGTQLWIARRTVRPLRIPLLGFDYPGEEILAAVERKRVAHRR